MVCLTKSGGDNYLRLIAMAGFLKYFNMNKLGIMESRMINYSFTYSQIGGSLLHFRMCGQVIQPARYVRAK